MPEAKIFIGSSTESLTVVDALEEALRNKTVTTKSGEQPEIKVERWDQDVFRARRFTLPQLQSEAEAVDFAVFVLGQDDRTESRREPQPSPRDNVVFEAGLFGGVLGMRRTFILHANGAKLPTDLLGLTCVRYAGAMTPAEVKSINQKIRKAIETKAASPASRARGGRCARPAAGACAQRPPGA